uniref:26S proteasome non-ATPase regulatory subunit 8 n=1 Tax=Parascaris univalens TaxID=6257 RepID=A0A915BDT8_PARUN
PFLLLLDREGQSGLSSRSDKVNGAVGMQKLDVIHRKLLDEWKKENKRDLKLVGEILQNAKNAMNNVESLRGLSDAALVTIHRDLFEIDALYAVLRADFNGFHEAITVVLNFYESYSSGGESPNKYLMIGLDLMYLLATNHLAEFHMLLEQVEQSVQQSNPYISTPVKLEQSLIEGVYNKVVLTEGTIPSPYYAVFIRILMDTVRGEIATCIERAFKRVSLKDATQLLLFNNESEVVPFTSKRGWKIENNVFLFDIEKPVEPMPKAHLDTSRIAKQTIFYAKQLEMIV